MAYLDADESFNEGASSDALLGGDSQGRLRLDRGLFSDEKGSRCHSRDASTGACRRARDFGLALAVGVVLGSLLTVGNEGGMTSRSLSTVYLLSLHG